jgi:dipeptidyl aminopeptidase/acylaminoacyl peptidase
MTDASLRTIEPADFVRWTGIEDPRVSPDGLQVAFVRVTADLDKNSYQRDIWLASVDGESLIRLTRTGKDSAPRWSPDGKHLAFVSGRGEKSQIYLFSVGQAGDPYPLTSLANGASTPVWSPDGLHLAFLSSLNAAERATEGDASASKASEADEKKKTDPRVISVMPYRSGTSYSTDRFSQIYTVEVSTAGESATPRRLTDMDVNHGEPVWMPDGSALLFSRAVNAGVDEAGRAARLFRLNLVDLTQERLTDDSHTDGSPVLSPDGRWLAWMRYPSDSMALRYSSLALRDMDSGAMHDINHGVDLNPLTLSWGGKTLYYCAQHRGSAPIYRYFPVTGEHQPGHASDIRAERFDAHESGLLAYAGFNAEKLTELYVQSAGDDPRPLTEFNRDYREETQFGAFERLSWNVVGTEVEGWVLTPPNFDASQRWPLVLDIHGGPHVMWSPHYESEWHNWQTLAAQGYVVFFANPRGSTGYGDTFQRDIKGVWGPLAQKEILAGLDLVLARGYTDPERVGIMGGSYGGYMTTWIISNDHRFKAAMAERGVYNLISFTGTTDIPSFIPDEFGVELPANPTLLWENSPLAHAHQITTPLLIIHSENDFRVAISEAEQMFAAVRRAGTPVEFVRYPREGHELSRNGEPQHRVDRLQRIIGWFDRYLKPS